MKYFRVYLHGTKFKEVTDHSALKWLISFKDPACRLARWSIYLQSYEFEIVHRKGKLHSNVDALSRHFVLLGKEVEETTEDANEKTLDVFEDEHLLYYIKKRKHMNGASKNQIKRILRQADHYKLDDDIFYFRKTINDTFNLIVPPLESREEIV